MTEDAGVPTGGTKRKLLRFTQGAVMLGAALLLVAHVIKWDRIRVDGVALALLGFLLVIPLVELIRKIKLGEFEAEIGKEEIAKAQAKVATDLPPAPDIPSTTSEEQIEQLLRQDPRLALAKVRIDLEETVKRLYARTVDPEPDWRRLSLGRMVDGLTKREVVSGQMAGGLRDVITLANRAVHGEYVETSAAQDLAGLGTRLAAELQHLYMERALRPVEKVVIPPEEADRYTGADTGLLQSSRS
ncbi:MAG TPA: hypothetical protein VFV34_02120 [Blastocatellia bacterium]|nr:hypothetical protein [Blastocatellia bacterium]